MGLNRYTFLGVMGVLFSCEASEIDREGLYGYENTYAEGATDQESFWGSTPGTLPSLLGGESPRDGVSPVVNHSGAGDDWWRRSAEFSGPGGSDGLGNMQPPPPVPNRFTPLSFSSERPIISSLSPSPTNILIVQPQPRRPTPPAAFVSSVPSITGKRKERSLSPPKMRAHVSAVAAVSTTSTATARVEKLRDAALPVLLSELPTVRAVESTSSLVPPATGKRKEREAPDPHVSRTYISVLPDAHQPPHPPHSLISSSRVDVTGIVNKEGHFKLLNFFGDGSQIITIEQIRAQGMLKENIHSFIRTQLGRGYLSFWGEQKHSKRSGMTGAYKITPLGIQARQALANALEVERRHPQFAQKVPRVAPSSTPQPPIASLFELSQFQPQHPVAMPISSLGSVLLPEPQKNAASTSTTSTAVAQTSRIANPGFNFFTDAHPQAQTQWEVYLHQTNVRDRFVRSAVSGLTQVLQGGLTEFAQRNNFSLRPDFEAQLMEYISRKVHIDTLGFKS